MGSFRRMPTASRWSRLSRTSEAPVMATPRPRDFAAYRAADSGEILARSPSRGRWHGGGDPCPIIDPPSAWSLCQRSS